MVRHSYRLSYFLISRRRQLTLILVSLVFFAGCLTFIQLKNESSDISSRDKILALSAEYIKRLADSQQKQKDGPYASQPTAYDLKKTLAILLDDLYRRLNVVEKRLDTGKLRSSPSANVSSPVEPHQIWHRSLQQLQQGVKDLVDFRGLLEGEQETCTIETSKLANYPECDAKLEWLKAKWKSHQCFADLGVDGTDCSILRYLSEVEAYCPPIEERKWAFDRPVANMRFDLSGLVHLISTRHSSHPHSTRYINARLQRMSSQWISGVNRYVRWNGGNLSTANGTIAEQNELFVSSDQRVNASGQPHFQNRRQLNVHVYLSLLSPSVTNSFEDGIDKGGPLGELVQWTDLLAGLYLLGHNLTISLTFNQLTEYLNVVDFLGTPCRPETNLVDLIFTDISGYKEVENAGVRVPKCKFRLLDSFGTHARYNRPGREANPWGGLKLKLKQFYNMFPHTPDNTFLGFVSESRNNRPKRKRTTDKPRALISGKQQYIWKNAGPYLRILSEFFELHGNVMDSNNNMPSFVVRHKRAFGEPYLDLLKSMDVVIGLGFPFEGPAPLEAIANGPIFLNPHFDVPKGRRNTNFFSKKPTDRVLTSQIPYVELAVAEPHTYVVDMENKNDSLRRTLRHVLARLDAGPYEPFEYTTTGFLERLSASLSHQTFCSVSADLLQTPLPLSNVSLGMLHGHDDMIHWPPLSSFRLIRASPGSSCTQACEQINVAFNPHTDYLRQRQTYVSNHSVNKPCKLYCSPEHFSTVNNRFTLTTFYHTKCPNVRFESSPIAPYYDDSSQTCVFQADSLWFDCLASGPSGSSSSTSRFCPCRDGLPGQPTLCTNCL